jgi:hypothetical protein
MSVALFAESVGTFADDGIPSVVDLGSNELMIGVVNARDQPCSHE